MALLIVDHQTGLFQLVRDTPTHEFFSNIVGLAETAKVYNVSTILTTSAENGKTISSTSLSLMANTS